MAIFCCPALCPEGEKVVVWCFQLQIDVHKSNPMLDELLPDNKETIDLTHKDTTDRLKQVEEM